MSDVRLESLCSGEGYIHFGQVMCHPILSVDIPGDPPEVCFQLLYGSASKEGILKVERNRKGTRITMFIGEGEEWSLFSPVLVFEYGMQKYLFHYRIERAKITQQFYYHWEILYSSPVDSVG